jgi:acetate kinase
MKEVIMKILSVNAGSSSLKFQMYQMPEETVLISGLFERIGISGSGYTLKLNGEKIKKEVTLNNHEDAVKILAEELVNLNVVSSLEEIYAIGHRVVHGGDKYADSVVINEDVLNTIKELSDLAPLHNPANLTGIKAFMHIVPNAIAVAVFDTAFHQTLKEDAYLYSVPYSWYRDYQVRKYGFHGTSHKYVTNRLQELLGKEDINAITCHLGNGASIAAIKNGHSFDTSMGFTPNAGLLMGTRSGDIDLTLIPYVMNKSNSSLETVLDNLNKNSGYLGISELSSDSRDIENAIEQGHEGAILAQTMYVRRIIEYIAKYYVLLGGIDAISFAGGIGENAIATRKEIIDGLKVLGIFIDEEKNNVRGKETLISTDSSSVKVFIIPTDEELMIARDTYSFAK